MRDAQRWEGSGTIAFDVGLAAWFTHCSCCGAWVPREARRGERLDLPRVGLQVFAVGCVPCGNRWEALKAELIERLEERYGP